VLEIDLAWLQSGRGWRCLMRSHRAPPALRSSPIQNSEGMVRFAANARY
jgi:hypothetical protein